MSAIMLQRAPGQQRHLAQVDHDRHLVLGDAFGQRRLQRLDGLVGHQRRQRRQVGHRADAAAGDPLGGALAHAVTATWAGAAAGTGSRAMRNSAIQPGSARADRLEHRHHARVELGAGAARDLGHRHFVAAPGAVGARAGDRVVGVGHRDDARVVAECRCRSGHADSRCRRTFPGGGARPAPRP